MSRPEVSVVIPVYDRPHELEAAVRSVLAQTDPCAEIIIVDDASPVPVEQGRLGLDPRIRIVRHDRNRGAGAARNTGIRAAGGRLVAFLDSDDRWAPGKLAAQRARLQERAGGWRLAAATGWRQKRGGRAETVIPAEAARLSEFARGCWFCPGSTLLVEREAFEIVGLFDERLRRLEDYEWFLRFALEGGRLLVEPAPLVDIRWHRTASPQAVAESAGLIESTYLARRSARRLAARSDRRLAAAYLAYVNAATHWYAGRKPAAIGALTKSLLARPRISLREADLFAISAIRTEDRDSGS